VFVCVNVKVKVKAKVKLLFSNGTLNKQCYGTFPYKHKHKQNKLYK